MSDEALWVWQGWEGPIDVATAAKLVIDEDPRAGVWVPMAGEPPELVDVEGTRGTFAVQTRPWNPIPCPEGMVELRQDIISRLFGV